MATSNDGAIRRYGPKVWQNIHKLTYPAILMGGLHYVMLQRVWDVESLTSLLPNFR